MEPRPDVIVDFPFEDGTLFVAGAEHRLVFASAQDCTKIEEGKTETVEFVAQTPSLYSFRCCVHCGWDHLP